LDAPRENFPICFDVVLKVSERCNLACPYCYYFFQEYDGNANPALISEKVVAELPGFLIRSLDELNIDRLNVVLHGGEPLLFKKERADHLWTVLRETVGQRVPLNLAVQTNGVLIDEEWIQLFAKHRIKVGVSIDGLKETHDRLRPDHQGRGSYDDAIRGLKMLKGAAAKGILEDDVGVLCVVHADGNSHRLLEHLVHDLGVDSPNLNFPRGGRNSVDARLWNQAVESHQKIVRYWIDNLIFPKFHFVRGIADVFFALHSEKGAEKRDRQVAMQHFIATISSAGDLNVDDNLMGIDRSLSDTGLKIFGTSLKALIESSIWRELSEAVDTPASKCKQCDWYRSCRGGELFNRFSPAYRFDDHSVLCDTVQMIHEELATYLIDNGLISTEELAARLERPPTLFAKQAIQQLYAKDAVDSCD
jgi:uncharacterized protein